MQAIRRQQIARLRALVCLIEQRYVSVRAFFIVLMAPNFTSDLESRRAPLQSLQASSDSTMGEHAALCTHSLGHNAAALGQFRQYAKDSKQSELLSSSL